MKSWYQSKTIWTGVTGVLAGIGTYIQTGDLNTLGTAVMGAVMIILRLVTKNSLG